MAQRAPKQPETSDIRTGVWEGIPERPVHSDKLARIKAKVVGKPLATERLVHERLGKPTALAVFASDNLSSSAYATEEILRVLLVGGGFGALAFARVVPITIALLAVLAVLLFSYRQTIKAYPQAGGAYLVYRMMRSRQATPTPATGYGQAAGVPQWQPPPQTFQPQTVVDPGPSDLERGVGYIRQMDTAFATQVLFNLVDPWTGREAAPGGRDAQQVAADVVGVLVVGIGV